FEVITQLGVGEALVSTLEKKGVPSIVQRTLIRPPASRMGPVTKKERAEIMAMSEMGDRYDETIDRESAYEVLNHRAEERASREAAEKARTEREKKRGKSRRKSTTNRRKSTSRARSSRRQSVGEAAIKSAARTFSSTLARELLRGLLGTFKRR
ncbi:MAG: helicase HerA-like domain-containing protein, partial [Pseudomonadota bacterium]